MLKQKVSLFKPGLGRDLIWHPIIKEGPRTYYKGYIGKSLQAVGYKS